LLRAYLGWNIWLKIIFLSQYCVQKCLVWKGPSCDRYNRVRLDFTSKYCKKNIEENIWLIKHKKNLNRFFFVPIFKKVMTWRSPSIRTTLTWPPALGGAAVDGDLVLYDVVVVGGGGEQVRVLPLLAFVVE